MRPSIFALLLFIGCCKYAKALYWNLRSNINDTSPGEPLFLTEYIRNGQIAEARLEARVRHPALKDLESYAGYLTINKRYNSNTFFWFFPSQRNPRNDPLILWFVGGPGLTCMVSILNYNGPYIISEDGILQFRNYSLAVNHSMLYIDNPIGSGFSFTDNPLGYARDMSDVKRAVITALMQFFRIFPEFQNNDFYVGGDSFGGKFTVSVANAIRLHNYKGLFYINLMGFILGNGLIDLPTQMDNSEYLYQLGLVDKKGKEEMYKFYQEFEDNEPDDRYAVQRQLTGFNYYSNVLHSEKPFVTEFVKWVVSHDFRKAVHVGNKEFNLTSDIVRDYFEDVYHNSVTAQLGALLRENFRVLVYNGQLDTMFPYSATEDLYARLIWPEHYEYSIAERKEWWLEGELVGYIKSTENFVDALIRNAGHVTFLEQPKWTCELVNRFTHHKPILEEHQNRLSRSITKHKYVYF